MGGSIIVLFAGEELSCQGQRIVRVWRGGPASSRQGWGLLGCKGEDQPRLVGVRGLGAGVWRGGPALSRQGQGIVRVWRGGPASSRRGQGIVGVLWYASVTEVSDLN